MPTYIHGGEQAIGRLDGNPVARWCKGGVPVDDPEGLLACQRLKRPLFVPHLSPGFSISPEDRVFAIGSCFARGIERALIQQGFNVQSVTSAFDDCTLQYPGTTPLGATNRYSTFSILDELSWGLDPSAVFPEEALVRLDERRWVDPHANPTLAFVDREGTLDRRRLLSGLTRRIAACRVVIMTLGLIEVWQDAETGLYINMSPTREMMGATRRGRYVFKVTSYEENRSALERIHRTLGQFGHPDVRIVITVSPVPLLATFTDRDVVLANTFSKSMLRTAAEAFAADKPNVDYFPSYEIVLNSDRKLAWTDDGRHVQGPMAQHVTRLFREAYTRGRQEGQGESASKQGLKGGRKMRCGSKDVGLNRDQQGKCSLCGHWVRFQVRDGVGLREATCPHCGGSRRNQAMARAIVQTCLEDPSCSLAEGLGRLARLRIYEAQATGPLHDCLKDLPGYVCSEYTLDLGPESSPPKGARCEDLENLTFEDDSFDLVLTQDVFEHVRHPERGFLEIDRVLKPGGHHLFTVPLHEGRTTTKRVHCLDDEELHLVPPVYHGDSLRKTGSLVYTDFGDDLLDYLACLGIPTEISVYEPFYEKAEISWVHDEDSYERYRRFHADKKLIHFFRYNSVVFNSTKPSRAAGLRPTFTGERFLPWVSGYPIMSYEHLHRYRFAMELVRGKKVLDLACGEGYGAHMLAREAESVIGVDIDFASVRHAKNRYAGGNLDFLAGSIAQLPILGTGRFDVIVCFEALEHLVDHAGLMDEVKRLLKKGGLFLVSTPNASVYSGPSAAPNPFHVKELDLDPFKALLETRFEQTVFYGQKVYPCSSIFPLAGGSGRSSDFVIAGEGGPYTFVPPESRKPRYFVAVASDVPIPDHERPGYSQLCDLSESVFRDKDARIAALKRELQRKDADLKRLHAQAEESESRVRELARAASESSENLLRASSTLKTMEAALPLLEEILDRLRTEESPTAEVLVHAGELCFALGMLPKSVDLFNKALSIEPSNDQALNDLGVVRLHHGEIIDARELFLKALRLNPDNVEARTNLASLSGHKEGLYGDPPG